MSNKVTSQSGRTVIRLGEIATARSGDKGNHANVGVVAFTSAGYRYLQKELSAQRVSDFFAGLGATNVERFELPNVWALNFMLYNALSGGAGRSLRVDTQGKLLGTAVLEMELPAPKNMNAMLDR